MDTLALPANSGALKGVMGARGWHIWRRAAQDHDAHFYLITAAETIAQRRRFTEAGVYAGMEELVDGSDVLFDERRAAFIKGVTEAIRAGENN